jgi:hypothetical protein
VKKCPHVLVILLSRRNSELAAVDVKETDRFANNDATVKIDLDNLCEQATGQLIEKLLGTKVHDDLNKKVRYCNIRMP